ncbi:hypothetical protein MFLAVUS_004437 [Mucor flavus]|uniref:Uncharacterized protein n=1 Tax=Mucor flavus TaxID=439312 RepID=A0ABP9YVX1_9FUNG
MFLINAFLLLNMPMQKRIDYLKQKYTDKKKQVTKCTDCGKEGHKHKGSYLCSKFVQKQAKADGSSSSSAAVVCGSCKNQEHGNARSKQCPNYKPTLTEVSQSSFEGDMERFTSVLRPEQQTVFTDKVIKLSEFIRNVTFPSQIFVNHYIIRHQGSANLSPTTVNLAASPTKFLPVLGYIVGELELISDSCTNPSKKQPGTTYEENIKQFYHTFDFKKFGFESVEELLSPKSRIRFTCFIMSDGFGACFVFARRKPNREMDPNVFKLEDFNSDEFEEHFIPCAIDPGRRQIFTASIAHSPEEIEVRRCSRKERACYTDAGRRAAYVELLKIRQNVKVIETNLPTAKTVNYQRLQERTHYLLLHLPRLFDFYSYKYAYFRFHDYRGRQRANAEVANLLINGGKKVR